MDLARLVQMANHIARNFAARGEDAAAAETATHIRAYWDPRMKAAILTGNPTGLDPIAAKAIASLRPEIMNGNR